MKILIGNLFDSKAQTLVNTVNCVGVMGKGIALEFKKRYPLMFDEYSNKCKLKEVKPGTPYLYQDITGVSVLNFPTKDNWRSPSKLSYIVDGLDWFVRNYEQLGIRSIAFPPLGCGNGGLTWELVGPIMYNKLSTLPIDIEIYAPFGTKAEHVSVSYLCDNYKEYNADVEGMKNASVRHSWYLILEVIKSLNTNRYSLHVGRVIFQKICYILTRLGVDTGFVFTQGSYGPYSDDIKRATVALSNANMIYEKNLGNMIEVTVDNSFKLHSEEYSETELDAVNKTVDLFSRVKNTEQVEMIATVIYAFDQLMKDNHYVSDEEVYKYVMEWKKRWKDSKQKEVCNTIINLAMLGWINIDFSNKLGILTEGDYELN